MRQQVRDRIYEIVMAAMLVTSAALILAYGKGCTP